MKKFSTRALILFLGVLMALPLYTELAHAKTKAKKPAERAIMHNNKGVTALYEADTTRAIFEFKTATELSPDYVEAWNNLGLAYKLAGKMELAILSLNQAIALDKKYASPYNHLGAVYYAQGNYDEAVKLFKKALSFNKKFSDAFYNLGITYVALAGSDKQKLGPAVDAFVQATTFDPEHPHAHNELARVYQTLGDYEKAIIRYRLALEINPNMTEGWLNLSKLYNETGEVLKAQQALNHVMINDPDSVGAHMNLGMTYLSEKNYALALKEFDTVIRKAPSSEAAYFNVGFTRYQLGLQAKNQSQTAVADTQFIQAINAYQSALKLKPNFVDSAYNIAFTYQTMGDTEHAMEWHEKTLALEASYARSLYALGELKNLAGQKSEAAKYFCRLLKTNTSSLDIDIKRIQEQVKSWGGCPR